MQQGEVRNVRWHALARIETKRPLHILAAGRAEPQFANRASITLQKLRKCNPEVDDLQPLAAPRAMFDGGQAI